jgi:hypothetical protein
MDVKLLQVGELVHVIERRNFSDDVRRHFLGQVEACNKQAFRVNGYLFVYDTSAGAFSRKPEFRTRIIPLDNRVIINVLPEGTSLEAVRYSRDAEGNLTLTEGSEWELDISEFSSKE